MSHDNDLGRLSLLELFREEAQAQAHVLAGGLLTLEHSPADTTALEECMRAAHSLKGAARIIDLQNGVDLAHAMEECFVAAQHGKITLSASHIDELLRGVDLLVRIGQPDPAAAVSRAEIDALVARLSGPDAMGAAGAMDAMGAVDAMDTAGDAAVAPPCVPVPAADTRPPDVGGLADGPQRDAAPASNEAPSAPPPRPGQRADMPSGPQRMLRVHADQLDRLLSLLGESLVESRRLKPFASSLLRIKRTQQDAARALDALYASLTERLDPSTLEMINDVRKTLGQVQQMLGGRVDELDRLDRRGTNLAQQLYDEALRCRMRPFGDAAHAYPRIVRDFARSLGKQVRLSIVGESTQVDRDILDMLDAPLGHLLRNALDHGVEPPDTRVASGKPAEATITLEARHSAGKLFISVGDDGRGIDLDALRTAILRRRLADDDTVARLSDHELLDFLLLPGFSMREQVTDVSGRGVGLDAVHEMVKTVRGTVRIVNEPGRGTRFVLQLPLTLSVIRSLLVEVGGEAYAFPLAHVRRTVELARADIDMLEGQQHFSFDGRPVGLVTAHQLLGTGSPDDAQASQPVVVIGDERETYGVAVDRFLGERMLVVQPLDRRLGKIKDVAAAALMENGDAVLILDVDDLLRSVDKAVRGGQLARVQHAGSTAARRSKQVLVVDDSLTVRELERKLLEKRGYDVTIAIDGMDALNALRGANFDLVVTDVDMPRMDGIELVTLIKRDKGLNALPVMIVSYKDREEDRRRGLDAGADYYLAKSSFHDEALLDAVRDLIGEAHT